MQLSDEQVNQIVQSVTDAVVKQMKAGQPPAGQAAAPAETPTQKAKEIFALEEGIATFLQDEEFDLIADFDTALEVLPVARAGSGQHRQAPRLPAAGQGPLGFLGLIAGIYALAAAIGYAATFVAGRLMRGSPPIGGPASIGETLRRAAANLVGFGAFAAGDEHRVAYAVQWRGHAVPGRPLAADERRAVRFLLLGVPGLLPAVGGRLPHRAAGCG